MGESFWTSFSAALAVCLHGGYRRSFFVGPGGCKCWPLLCYVCVCVGVCVSLRPGLLRFASLCCRSPRLCALFWRSSDGPSPPSRLLASLVLTVHHTTRLGFYRDNRPSKS